MRSIPLELRQKLEQYLKAQSNNSEEGLSIIASPVTSNTLVSEPIHEDINGNFGDVALRQIAGENEISLAYAICIEDGNANIYQRRFPADVLQPWEFLWSVGKATDVGIEFQGTWELSSKKEWYYLQTEEYPYVFWINNQILYAQKWKDSATRIELDTGVSHLSVCKGWKSKQFNDQDQGLIVGYIKNGRVYYRAYCSQSEGSFLWEPSYPVTGLEEGNTYLSVFRTNDFRIGFITQNNGNILWCLSARNYAGMSVRPETAMISLSNPIIYMTKLVDHKFSLKECVTSAAKYVYVSIEPPTIEGVSVSKVEKLNNTTDFYSYGFRLYMSKTLYGTMLDDFIHVVTLSDGTKVIQASYEADKKAIVLLFSSPIKRTLSITITIGEYRPMFFYGTSGQRLPFLGVTAASVSEAIVWNAYENDKVAISITSPTIQLAFIKNTFEEFEESIGVGTDSTTVQLAAISNLPI